MALTRFVVAGGDFQNEYGDLYAFGNKWSPEIADSGHTQVPNALLKCQGHLGLKDGELLTLINLLSFQYKKTTHIFPSIGTLSRAGENGYSTVQRRLRILEEKGFIQRIHKQGRPNTFDVEPCIDKLERHLKECSPPPQMQSVYGNVMRRPPSSPVSSEEDEALRRPILNKTKIERGKTAGELSISEIMFALGYGNQNER
jgi:predicted transcriptional regulator